MDSAATSVIELGIDFVPVPGLKAAFHTLVFIWDSVKKASKNKEALRNLVSSTVKILKAIHHALLPRNKISEHVSEVLHDLEKLLNEIEKFAAEHVTTSLFIALIKNVDIDGRIEFFQSRLQHLWMAFNIYVSIVTEARLENIFQGQLAILRHLSLPSTASVQDPKNNSLRCVSLTGPLSQVTCDVDDQPVRVEACFTEPRTIKIHEGVPSLISHYFPEADLSFWGLKAAQSYISKRTNRFEVVRPQDSRSWTWAVSSRVISISRRNPDHPDWKDTMDIVFPTGTSATAWFLWFEGYAPSGPATPALVQPPKSYNVIVRSKYDCWMGKTAGKIECQRPGMKDWTRTLSGHSQNSRAHLTHFTYVTTSGTQPFTTVYRSANTIVQERYVRADNEKPTTTRRFRFMSEETATAWYTAWKTCALGETGGNEPVRVIVRASEPRTILSLHRIPVLASSLWPEIQLGDWGLQKAKVRHTSAGFVVTTGTTSWAWTHNGKSVMIYTAISSHPDWFDTVEITFHDTKSSEAWFLYLRDYASSLPCRLPPPSEHVTITYIRVTWIQKTAKSINILTAMSDRWSPIFGTYSKMQDHGSHLYLMSNSILPHYRISRSEQTLIWERRASADDVDVPVAKRFQFNSESEAIAWFEIWKAHLKISVLGVK